LLEINSQPDRLDLDDIDVQMAKDKGVRLSISTDARATDFARIHALRCRSGVAGLAHAR